MCNGRKIYNLFDCSQGDRHRALHDQSKERPYGALAFERNALHGLDYNIRRNTRVAIPPYRAGRGPLNKSPMRVVSPL